MTPPPAALSGVTTRNPSENEPEKHTPFRCVQNERINGWLSEMDALKAAVIVVSDGQAQIESKIDLLLTREHDKNLADEVAEATLSEVERDLERSKESQRVKAKDRAEWLRWAVTLTIGVLGGGGVTHLLNYIAAHWR